MKTKERINLTIDIELYKNFRELTESKLQKKSTVVEFLIKEWIKENKDVVK